MRVIGLVRSASSRRMLAAAALVRPGDAGAPDPAAGRGPGRPHGGTHPPPEPVRRGSCTPRPIRTAPLRTAVRRRRLQSAPMLNGRRRRRPGDRRVGEERGSGLLDTDLVSEIRKIKQGTTDDQVIAWARSVHVSSMWLSLICVHELELGGDLVERRDPTRGQLPRQWLEARRTSCRWRMIDPSVASVTSSAAHAR